MSEKRRVVRVSRLSDRQREDDLRDTTPGHRMAMVWQLTKEAWLFMLVGVYALAVHGLPRSTGDIDLWIRSSTENAGGVWRAPARYGAPLTNLTEKDLQSPGTVIQIGVPPNRIDLLTSLDGREARSRHGCRASRAAGALSGPITAS